MQLNFFDDIARLGGLNILTQTDAEELAAGVRRVYYLMKDGEWHDPDEIKQAAGDGTYPASEGLRRLRELRRWFAVEKKRVSDSRLWIYRLATKTRR